MLAFVAQQAKLTPNEITVVVIAIILFLLFFKPKRSRHIPTKSKRLADAKHVQEFYDDPANEGKPYRRKKHEYDHHVPFSKGGSHDSDNIKVIPKKANRKKGSKMPGFFD